MIGSTFRQKHGEGRCREAEVEKQSGGRMKGKW